MSDEQGTEPGGSGRWPIGLVQREVVLVVVLAAAAAVLFGMTRSFAEWAGATADRTAAEWHARGEALVAAGRTSEGIAFLRRAVSFDRLNATYVLALVRALSDPSRDEDARAEARRLLLQLREREPDRPEVNLRLARLAAAAGEAAEAIRYYNHAMYGLAPGDPRQDRRRIRVELAAFLLDQGDTDRALGELVALVPDVPDQAPDHVELGRLFLRAGDTRSALTRFTTALGLDPKSAEAAAGAGEAALTLGAFAQAERFLETAIRQGAVDPGVAARLETVRLVRALHPLSAGLVSSERVARLRAGLDWAAGRLVSCARERPPAAAGAADPLVEAVTRFRRRPISALRESDALVEGINLIARAVDEIGRRCQDREAAEGAWRAIAASPEVAAG